MIYTQTGQQLRAWIQSAGYTLVRSDSEAEITVVELPDYRDCLFRGPVLYVLTGMMDYHSILDARKTGPVIAVTELMENPEIYLRTAPAETPQVRLWPQEQHIQDDQTTPDEIGRSAAVRSVRSDALPTPAAFIERPLFPARGSAAFVVASFSTKGGVGKTSVALNIAAYHARRGMSTVLVDLDIGTGDYKELFGLSDQGPTVQNWRSYARTLSASLFRHRSTGMAVLPGGPAETAEITASEVEDLIGLLGDQFEMVVLDFGVKPNHAHTRKGLEMADRVLAVVDPRRGMMTTLLEQFWNQHPDWSASGKLQLVVNLVRADSHYESSELARMAGVAKFYEIPEDPAFELAKKGHKAVIELKNSPAGRELANLAADLLGVIPAVQKKPTILERLWR
ncbi:MAG: AAA family ATPase [Solirubrobacterales bacterium]